MSVDTNRVLRVGVVWRGQVVAERVLDRRVDLTVGTKPEATLHVDAKTHPGFPVLAEIAALHHGAYHVVVPTDPTHQVSLRGGIAGNAASAKEDAIQVHGRKLIPFEYYTGGSVTLGDVIVMFQFVRSEATPTVTRQEIVLRVGLVHESRLISDQVYPLTRSVSVGGTVHDTLSLPDVDYKGASATFAPDKAKGKVHVRVPVAGQMRLSAETDPIDGNEAVKRRLATKNGDFFEFDLPVGGRGLVALGPYTVLFQLLKQTAIIPAPAKRSFGSYLTGAFMSDSTWTTSLLIAIVLTASIVGQALLFNRTTGRFLDKAMAEEELTTSTYEVLIEQKEEPKPEEEKPVIDIMSDAAKKAEQKELDKEAKKAKKEEKPQSIGQQIDPEERRRNAREAVQKRTIAGAFMQGGAATKLFGEAGEGEAGDVVAKTFGGAGGEGEGDGPSAGLKLAGGGSGGATMERVATGSKGFGTREAGETKIEANKQEKKLNISLSMGEMGGSGEAKADVAKVVSRKNSAVQRCYEQALRDNPEEGGKVKVIFTVGTAGTVTDVSVSGASGAFADCIRNKFQAIRGLPALPAPQSFNQSYVFSKN
jgi:outer membrane biosynthesis protein TonB